MINVNILNNLIKGISEQIPLVQSYYTTSPYESWNVEEVKYGSVSFVITRVNTRETTTTFDATIYYADRLLEDNSNRDYVHSDAATVIQNIVGALNTADEYLEVSYPVGITLFEQDFADKLAGGYAQVSISAEGMGECFEDEFSVPEIIATSAYYTKEEINQLFPLKTELSTVAFTGSFNDLKDRPDLVIKSQFDSVQNELNNVKDVLNNTPSKKDFDNLTQAVVDSTSSLAGELEQKLNVSYFDTWADGIEADLATRPTGQNFDTLRQDLTDQIDIINKNVNNKVSSAYFESWKTQTESSLNSKASTQALNNLSNELNTTKNSLQQQIDKKVTEDEVKAILGDISSEGLATKAELEALESEVETNARLTATALESKVSVNIFNAFKDTITTQTGNGVTKQEFDNLTEAVAQSTASLAAELDKKVNVTYFDGWADGIESMLDKKVSQQSFDNAFSNVYNKTQTYSKSEIDKKLDNVVVDGDINLSDYYTKDEVDDIISNIDTSDIDLSDYAKKNDVYTKSETYSRPQIDAKLADIEVGGNGGFANITERTCYLTSYTWAFDLNGEPSDETIENIEITDEQRAYNIETYELCYGDKPPMLTHSGGIFEMASGHWSPSEGTGEVCFTRIIGDPMLLDRIAVMAIYINHNGDAAGKVKIYDFYSKEEIDTKLDGIISGSTVDLSNYYKKSETYSKTEIDATIGNINTILNNVLYIK